MADAGKIMIMPKGAYDASASYEVLDLVTHKGNVWVAKRNVTGVEPNSANSADWFLMADLANYLSLSGGTVNGNITAEKSGNTDIYVRAKNALANILLFAQSNGTHGLYDSGLSQWIVEVSADGSNKKFNGTATGNLPLSGGGTVTKDASTVMQLKNSTADRTYLGFVGSNTLGYLGFESTDTPSFVTKAGLVKTLLHTGNKPTGTYTGSGSAYQNVAVGGTGEFVMVSTDGSGTKSDFVIVSQNGYFGKVGGAVVQGNNMYTTSGGALIIDGVTAFLTSGKQYRYQRL